MESMEREGGRTQNKEERDYKLNRKVNALSKKLNNLMTAPGSHVKSERIAD